MQLVSFRVRFQTQSRVAPVPYCFPQHHTPSHRFPEIELENHMTHGSPHHKVILKIFGLETTLKGNKSGNAPPLLLGSGLSPMSIKKSASHWNTSKHKDLATSGNAH
jgi:hypothetical protein